ncbi:MAG: phytanoyl-CoA dioxygenase family protein [Candidatus Glassbacteria bacterium]
MSEAAGTVGYRKIAGMAGKLFPRAGSAGELKKYELSRERLDFFREHGYLTPLRVLDKQQLDLMREGLERMTGESYPRAGELIGLDTRAGLSKGEQMIYFQGAWMVEEAFHDIIYNPVITVPAGQLLGSSGVRFWHDQLFYKPARHGGVVAWHQDYSYWTRTEPVGHLTCFIALDDTTLENGCLHVIPGSHKWNLLPMTQLVGSADAMERIKSVLTPEQLAAFKPDPITLEAGQASFHHPLALHGSYSNHSDRHRRALVLNFLRPDVRSASAEPLMPGADPVPKGEVVAGEYFPLVLEG